MYLLRIHQNMVVAVGSELFVVSLVAALIAVMVGRVLDTLV